jgi:4'-phosphopantetheinyl transferase
MSGSLSGVHVDEALLLQPAELVTRLRTLKADQPPLILIGNRCELASMLTKQMLHQFLPQEERSRIEEFFHLADQQRFVIGRSILRAILGHWFSIEPSSVAITLSTYGKPYCENAPFFNISHSGDYIVLAIHPSRKAGIDVEQVQHYKEWKGMAAMLWPEIVTKHIESFPVHSQSTEFLNQWCQYEALTKAYGLGLSAQWEKIASEKPCHLWKLSLPETYLGYAAML